MSKASRLWRKIRHSGPDLCLYVYPFSIQSIVVQFTIGLAVRGRLRPPRDLAHLSYRLVNLEKNENLQEWYLLQVNPLGRVPTLTIKSSPEPMTDRLSIIYWVCEQCPALLPHVHRAEIRRLITQLHEIFEWFNSSNPAVEDLLTNHDITPAHRRALEYKQECQRKQREMVALNMSDGYSMTNETRVFLREIVQQRNEHSHGSAWIFGDSGPTVLDAHVVAYIARLIDIGLEDLVPPELRVYAETIMTMPEWHEVMKGRPTVWDPLLGDIDELEI
ncbi:glutathione S-transferase family protein [Aspergillus lucknowensis]|uniref:GST N-terminal domain-containing protein n=1 Tax=Aspergillus lucknowensis TaxID=176173 RepID=A0ABR4LST8_9EURO